MPTQTYNATQAQDTRKGANKRKKITAADMAIASYVFSQGDSAYQNAGDEQLGYAGYQGATGESQANIEAMRQRSRELIDHLNEVRYGEEGSYDDTVGDVEVETSLLGAKQTDTITQRNALSRGLRNVFGDRISNYKAFGASFSEFDRGIDTSGSYQEVFTNEIMDIAPGISVDAASIALKGRRGLHNKHNITIELLRGGKEPRLTLYTGITGTLMDFDIDQMTLSNTGANTNIALIAGRGDTRPLVEKLSPKLSRKLTYTSLRINTYSPEGMKMGRPVLTFITPKVEYVGDSAGADIGEDLKRIQTNKLDSAEFVAGSGMIIKDNTGADTYTAEKKKINADLAAENAGRVAAVPAPAQAANDDPFAKLGEYHTQEELAEEKAKEDKKEAFDDYTFDPLHQFSGMGKVKGLSGTVQGNEKGQTKIDLKFSATGNMFGYLSPLTKTVEENGETKEVPDGLAGQKYDNFFDFLLGNATQDRKNAIEAIKKKVDDGEELTFAEMKTFKDVVTTPSIAQQGAEIFGRTFLGDFITDLGLDAVDWIKMNNTKGVEGYSFFDMLLYHFLGDHLATLVNEFMSGEDEDKPAITYLKKYISDLMGFSKGADGSTLAPFEDSTEKTNIECFPYMFDEAGVTAKEAKANTPGGGAQIRVPIAPGVIAGASFTPFFNFSPSAGLSMEPSGTTFSEAKKAFKDDVLGKGKSPEQLKQSDLEESFKKCYKDIGYVIKPSIGAKVSAGLDAKAFIMAGAGMILSAKGQLDGKLTGTAGLDIGGAFKLTAPNGYLKLAGLTGASIKGSLSASGDVGMKLGLSSELLSWEYNILELSLFKAALKELSIGADMTLEEGAGDFANFGTFAAAKFEGRGFQNAIEKEGVEKFSLEKVEAPRGMQTMIDEASAYNGGFDQFKGRVNSILKVLLSPNYFHAIDEGGAPSFDQLKTIFARLATQLAARNEDIISSVNSLKAMKQGYTNGDAYQKKLKFILGRIKKHSDLKTRMEGYDPSNPDQGSALSYYKKGRYFDGQNDFEKYQKQRKIEELAGSDMEVSPGVTRKRYQVILENKLARDLKKNNDVKDLIKIYDPSLGDFAVYYENIYGTIYGRKAKSAIYKHLGVSDVSEGSKKRLMDFEAGRGKDKSIKHVKNLEAIRKFIKDNKLDPMAPSKEFSNWYFKNVVGVSTRGAWLKRQAVDYLTPQMLLAVMNKKLRNKAVTKDGNTIYERIATLERYNKQYLAAKAKADKGDIAAGVQVGKICKEARDFFFAPKGRMEEVKKHFYRTGTKEQILEYESSWKNKAFVTQAPAAGGAPAPGVAPAPGGAAPAQAGSFMEKEAAVLAKLQGIMDGSNGIDDISATDKNALIADLQSLEINTNTNGARLTGIDFWKNRKLEDFKVGPYNLVGKVMNVVGKLVNYSGNALNVIDAGSKSSVGKRREIIAKNVTLETILRYEDRRAVDPLLDDKEKERHAKVRDILKGRKAMLMKETDPDRVKKILEDLRADYFSGKIDLSAGKQYKNATHLQLLKDIESGKETDFHVLAAMLKKDQESFRNDHAVRTEQLSEMFKNNPKMSDLEAYYKYHDQMRDYIKARRLFNVRGGYEDYVTEQFLKREGKRELNDDALRSISIAEMLRYEKRKMAENSRSVGDYVGTRVVDRLTSVLPGSIFSVDEDKDKEANALYMEGYYGLYEKMQALYNKAEGDDEDDKAEKFSEMVRANLLAGAFGKRGFFNDFLSELPPMAAIQYEEKRANEEKEKYTKRQEMIAKMGGVFPAGDEREEVEALTPQDLERYLTASRADNTFKRVTTRDKNYQTAYDEALEKSFYKGHTDILNKDLALNYHNRLELEIAGDTKKIEMAIEALGGEATDEAKLKAFMDNGGSQIIMDDPALKAEIETQIKRVNQSDEVMGDAFLGIQHQNKGAGSAAEIIQYEQSRIAHYESLQAALEKPITDMDGLVRSLEDNSRWANDVISTISAATPEQLFTNHALLDNVGEMVKKDENGAAIEMGASQKLIYAYEELQKIMG